MAFGYSEGTVQVSLKAAEPMVGGAIGVVQAVGLQALDARGALGPAPVPKMGGFGTWSGLVNLISGAVGVVVGGAGVFRKGPLKNKPHATGAVLTYGATALLAQTVVALAGGPAVTQPLYLARRAAAVAAGGPAPAAPAAAVAAVPLSGAAI